MIIVYLKKKAVIKPTLVKLIFARNKYLIYGILFILFIKVSFKKNRNSIGIMNCLLKNSFDTKNIVFSILIQEKNNISVHNKTIKDYIL